MIFCFYEAHAMTPERRKKITPVVLPWSSKSPAWSLSLKPFKAGRDALDL